MTYWACAQLEPNRERIALHCLGLAGYETYLPRLRERRVSHGRKIEVRPPLFPGYLFVVVEREWYSARWSVGVRRLIMDGVQPARVPDVVVEQIKGREVRGLVELPKSELRLGACVQVLHGPLQGQLGLVAGMRPRDRILVLLTLLGGQRQVELAKQNVEPVEDSRCR
jgi:transcription antitermination factor NusG